LEEIEKKSQALLEKGAAARFVDKGGDSAEVTRLIERLREAITRYQVSKNHFFSSSTAHMEGQLSQQQAIYDRIADLTVRILLFPLYVSLMTDSLIKSSFDTLLKLHEVMMFCRLVAPFADAWTEIPSGEGQAGFRHGQAGSALFRG